MTCTRPVLGSLAAVALLAAGCGGSSSSSGNGSSKPANAKPASTTAAKPAKPAGPPPSKSEYVRRADSVCREARTVSIRANQEVSAAYAANDTKRVVSAIDKFGSLYADKIAKLEAIPQPKGKSQTLTQILQLMDAQVKALARESEAMHTGDKATVNQMSQTQQQILPLVDKLGRQYGFKVCGRSR